MGKDCNPIYLDAKGKRSVTYYETLKEQGEEAALKAYIDEMMPVAANLRFEKAKESPIKRLSETDESVLKNTEAISVTSALDEYGGELPPSVISAVAVNFKARDLMAKARDNGETLYEDEAKQEARKYFGIEPGQVDPIYNHSEFIKYKAEVQDLYYTQKRYGDAIHLYLERVFNFYQKAEHKEYEGHWNMVAREAYADVLDELDDDIAEIFRYSTISGSLQEVAKDFIQEVREFEKEYGEAEIFAEQPIISKKVKIKDKPIKGKIDLLIVAKKSNKARLFDYKTKSVDSLRNFDNIDTAKMSPPFDTLVNNSKTKAELQLTFYKKSLEEDYDLDVVGSKIGVVVGRFEYDDPGAGVGGRGWKLTGIDTKASGMVEARTHDGLLESEAEVEGRPRIQHEIDKTMGELFQGKWETSVSNQKSYIEKQLKRAKRDGNVYVWIDPTTGNKRVAPNESKLKTYIKEAFVRQQRIKKNAAVDAKNAFLKGGEPARDSVWARQGLNYKHIMKLIFEDAHPDHYDVYVPGDFKELAGLGDDILFIVNKSTKEVKIVSILPMSNRVVTFHEQGEEPRTTLFGPWLTDEAAKKMLRNTAPKATLHTMNMARLGAVAHKLRTVLPEFSNITDVQSVTAYGKADNMEKWLPDEALALWKVMAEIHENSESTEPLNPLIKELDDAAPIMPDNRFFDSVIGRFVSMLMDNRDPLKIAAGPSDKGANKIVKLLKARIKELNDFNEEYEGDVKLMGLLEDYLKRLYITLYKRPDINGKDAVFANELYQQANNAYLASRGMLTKSPSRYKKSAVGGFQSAMLMGDEDAEMLHFAIMEAEQAARDVLTSYLSEHDKLLTALMKAKGFTLPGQIIKGDVSMKLFENMLEDGYKFDPDNVKNWMKFKKPEDLELEEEREYVRFFNKKIKEFAKLGYTRSKYLAMFPDTSAQIQTGVPTWEEGYIPIMPKKASNAFKDTELMIRGSETNASTTKEAVKRAFKSIFGGFAAGLKKLAKPVENGKRDTSEPWELRQIFVNQVDAGPGRGSHETRKLLGIDEDNNYIGTRQAIETNPALILNLFAVDVTRQKFMAEAKMAHQAIDAKLVAEKSAGIQGAEDKRKALDSIAQLRIDNRVDDEGQMGQIMDGLKRVAAISIFGGSTRQAVADFTTTTLQMTSASLGNALAKTLFNYQGKFGFKDVGWAKKHMTSKFGAQIMTDYGLFNSSLGEFTESEYNATMRNSMWQTKHMTAHFRTILRKAVQDVILAQMHHDGVTEDVFDRDEKTGRYIYNEAADPRFYVYDEKLAAKGYGHSEPPSPDTENYKKWKKWQAARKMLRGTRGIDEKTGRMKHPYSIKELNTMKQEAIRLFGAMDSSEAVVYETSAVWRSLLTFRKWIIHRVANFNFEKTESWRKAKWVEKKTDDGDVYFEYSKGEVEGLLQSMGGMYKDIMSIGLKGAIGKMSDSRKENLGKLISDLLMTALLYAFASWIIGMDFGNKAFVTELQKGFNNSLGDMNILASGYYAVTSDAMPSMSMMGSFMKNTATSIYHGVTGDPAGALSAGDNAMSLFGVYRTGKALGLDQLILGDEID